MWAFFIEEGIQWGLLDLTNMPPRLGWAGLAVDKAAVCCDVAAAQGPDCFTRLSQVSHCPALLSPVLGALPLAF